LETKRKRGFQKIHSNLLEDQMEPNLEQQLKELDEIEEISSFQSSELHTMLDFHNYDEQFKDSKILNTQVQIQPDDIEVPDFTHLDNHQHGYSTDKDNMQKMDLYWQMKTEETPVLFVTIINELRLLRSEMFERFERVDQKVEKIEYKLSHLHSRLDQMERKLDRISLNPSGAKIPTFSSNSSHSIRNHSPYELPKKHNGHSEQEQRLNHFDQESDNAEYNDYINDDITDEDPAEEDLHQQNDGVGEENLVWHESGISK